MGHKNKHGGKNAGGEASSSATGHKTKWGGKKAAAGVEASSSSSLQAPSFNFNPKDVTDPFELLDMCVAALHDKRASGGTRESALASLAGALERVVPLDEATDGRPLVIFALCGASIKRGNASPAFAKEARLAYRAVGLLAFTLLNGGSTEILAESFPMLARTLQLAPSMDPATVAAALHCLAAVTFAGALGPEEAERSLKTIWGVICPNPKSPKVISSKVRPHVVAAAVSTWTFLVTTAAVTDAQRKADRAAWNAAIASLAGVLEADDRAVRMAAGEALAVCVELNLTQHTPRKDMDAILARVSDLAAEAGGKGADKTLFVEQKDLFRQILAYMEHGERPRKALRTSSERRESIKVSTWAKMAQINFLRRFLAGGFLAHVKGNKLFKELFDVAADEKAALSIAKRKLMLKVKGKGMKMNREVAWAVKNVYCLPQGGPPESNKPDQLLKLGWH
ncbi:uncharacterized protein [Setaria viridis]|uniref:Interferon-related developmental regulator N-terminal domain-containing protein n=1 Tax=Setaria viridis TaxID=4556 RepID=A0A4U6W547_SETVI|nr:uncharacterized protein LOC117847521 [Setaria viridis]TKW37212.1 hypothetical protein SEVIR_1G033800v2 [Setaria viridis]